MKSPPNNPSARRPKGVPSLPFGTEGSDSAATPLGAGRRWLFRLFAGLLLPLIALALLETGLRLGGSGYPTGFFQPRRIGDRDFLVQNDSFAFRFFPPAIARMPATLRLPAHKAPGTYRIFVLGESAALGDPEPAYGAARYLEMLLRERYPRTRFEVVNVAMTAINSHAILPIARDCARQAGDLWILYLGNNEMVGPFGAATVFGAQAPPWPMVRLNLAIQQLRLGQLLAEFGGKLREKTAGHSSWAGMNMFAGNEVAPEDPRKLAVYRNFQKNLNDILRVGARSGAHILLSSMAVNLPDCPPFASRISGRLSVGDSNQVVQLLAAGNASAGQGDWGGAASRYEQAARLHPQSAELEYRWGQCLLARADLAAARVHFQNALDWDCLPFRADSHINALIGEAARQFAGPGLTWFEAAAVLENNPSNALPGQDDFYEHVHLNFDGNYRLARAWAGFVAGLLPPDLAAGGRTQWASQETCERRLGLTDWDRCEVLEEVCRRMRQPPLSGQFNNGARLQVFAAAASALRSRQDAAAAAAARAVYAEAVSAAPEDFYLRERFAGFLAAQGELAGAVEQWQKVRALMPQDYAVDYELGRLAGQERKYDDARSALRQALSVHASFAPAWFELGRIETAAGDYAAAVRAFDQALKYEPQDAQSWFGSGLALAMLNRSADAIARYQQAVQYAPDDWKAHFELGGLLGQAGRMAEACDESAAAVRLNPDFPTAHLNLGLALVQLHRFPEAEQQFVETLRLDPANAKAADDLEQTRALKLGKP